MTIAELKNHVFEALKVPVKDQRLLLTGRPLCGNYSFTLKFHNSYTQYVIFMYYSL